MELISTVTGDRLLALLFSPASRMCLLYLAVALPIAWWLRRIALAQGPLPAHLDSFSATTWLSRSAVNDYGLLVLNALILAQLSPLLRIDTAALVQGVADALPALPLTLAAGSSWWAPMALALALFVVDDFLRFFAHWTEHKVPLLWRLHKVHHSAQVLNFVTAERHHPLSMTYFSLIAMCGAASVNGLFLWLFHQQLSPTGLLGANLFWIVSNLAGGTLRHSPTWFSFGPRIERWIISPAQHQIHHSTDPRHFDRNMGGTLAIWDRLFGTLYVPQEREILTFGLGEETPAYRSLLGLYLQPLVEIAAMARPALRAGAASRPAP